MGPGHPRRGRRHRSAGVSLLLVRHASAGDRPSWTGDQRLRPLDDRGRRQAADLVAALASEPFARVLASPHLRCIQTVEPLAAARGYEVEPDERLSEGNERAALELVRTLLTDDAVLCTHGDVIPAILRAAARDGVEVPAQVPCELASTWILGGTASRFDNARYVTVG